MPLGIAHTYADYQVKWAMAFLQDEAVQLACVPAITRGVEVDEAKQASQHLELGLCKKPQETAGHAPPAGPSPALSTPPRRQISAVPQSLTAAVQREHITKGRCAKIGRKNANTVDTFAVRASIPLHTEHHRYDKKAGTMVPKKNRICIVDGKPLSYTAYLFS